MKPRIGITVDGVASQTANPYPHYRTRQLYAEAIEKAGGVPILLPWSVESVSDYVGLIDGLVVTGGDDIDPQLYGETDIHPSVKAVFPERTAFEWAMIEAMVAAGKSVLGICGGMQLLNVWAGGTLYQDISLTNLAEVHEQGRGNFFSHPIKLDPSSWMYGVLQTERLHVNSFHHQVVRDVGPQLKATAWSEDGLIEALESQKDPRILGVQWHPEYGDGCDPQWMKAWVTGAVVA